MTLKTKLIAALKTWIVIYPSLLLFQYLFANPLSALPLYQRTFLLTIALVPWIIFVCMPFINFLIAKLTSREKL
ncbi:MAG: hypothetical protein JWQ30_1261 [Sediminibacterium sp.]|nr:hypothetical protein [Sediminibacterium sp.]